jgi:hypothetical protein
MFQEQCMPLHAQRHGLLHKGPGTSSTQMGGRDEESQHH